MDQADGSNISSQPGDTAIIKLVRELGLNIKWWTFHFLRWSPRILDLNSFIMLLNVFALVGLAAAQTASTLPASAVTFLKSPKAAVQFAISIPKGGKDFTGRIVR